MYSLITALLLVLIAVPAWSWDLALPDTAVAEGPLIELREIVTGPMPEQAARIVIQTERRPGTTETISRRAILRTLVSRGCAAGVRMLGAERCVVVATGRELQAGTLRGPIERELVGKIPPAAQGAPASWLELKIPDTAIHLAAEPSVRIRDPRPLKPGRNQVSIELESGGKIETIPVIAILHSFAETATAQTAVVRGQPLDPRQFTWNWQDLAGDRGDAVLGREALAGNCSARTLAAGDPLRSLDLKPTPVVRIGDPVELLIQRGAVAVSVRGFARQAGCLGQTIPIRNELTGRLVNARVTGPGLVEWRR